LLPLGRFDDLFAGRQRSLALLYDGLCFAQSVAVMRSIARQACIVLSLLGSLAILPAHASPIGFAVRADTGDTLWAIDLATGKGTEYGFIPFGAEGLEFVDGRLYAIDPDGDLTVTDKLWDVTPPGGVPAVWPFLGIGTPVGPLGPMLGSDGALAADAAGALYALNGWVVNGVPRSYLYSIDVLTGAATHLWDAGFYADAFAIDDSGVGYAVDGKYADGLYRVNLATGAFEFVGGLGLGNTLLHAGLAFDADGRLWLMTTGVSAAASRIYEIDPLTGLATFVNTVTVDIPGLGTFGKNGFQSLAINRSNPRQVAQVPEPAIMAMVGVGLLSLRRRR
jgi:hypothetical protein